MIIVNFSKVAEIQKVDEVLIIMYVTFTDFMFE